MKNILLLLFLSFNCTNILAQIKFSNVYYEPAGSGINGSSIIQTPDKGFLITGSDFGSLGMVIKLDSTGVQEWRKDFSIAGYPIPSRGFNSVFSVNDSCYFMSIVGFAPINGSYIFSMKISPVGDTIWTSTIFLPNYNHTIIKSVQQTFDMGFVLVASYWSNATPQEKAFVVKFDSSGNIEWKMFVTSIGHNNLPEDIKQTPDSGYVVFGTHDAFYASLVKLSVSGNVEWSKEYSTLFITGNNGLRGRAIEVLDDGLLCLLFNDLNLITFMKLDFYGNILWIKSFMTSSGGLGQPFDAKLNRTKDKGYVFAIGYENPYHTTGFICIDSSLNILLSLSLTMNATEAIQTEDGGYAILGNGVDYQATQIPQLGVIKTDSLGSGNACTFSAMTVQYIDSLIATNFVCTTVSSGVDYNFTTTVFNKTVTADINTCLYNPGIGVNEIDFNLHHINIYPNPNDGQFYISGNANELTAIDIYDIMGQLILSKTVLAGLHFMDLSDKPKGVYFITLRTEKNSITKKVVLY